MRENELIMGSDTHNARKHSLTRKFKVWGIVVLCGLLLCIMLAALGILKQIRQKPSKTSPPNLSRCTHIEIQYYPSIIKFFSGIGDPNFLSAAETEYLQSLKKIVNDDKKSIKAFAHELSLGSYKGVIKGNIPMGKPTLSIVCYRNDERIAFITIYGPNLIVTEKGHWFDYDRDLPILLLLAPQHIKPLVLRVTCGGNLWVLYDELYGASRSTKAYPVPTGWCDIIVRDSRDSDFGKEEIREFFKCPCAGKGKSHYALNPNCRPNSPRDTVLLFETEAGWNQQGGPELFTFDNHDPKGGCVLLNDGTVKFIRTKEELNKLRWK